MKNKNYIKLLKNLIKKAPDSQREKAIKLYEDIKQEKVNVCFLGEFSSGKSSLIDAIIGKKLLPSKVIPTTSHMIKIYNGSPKLKIYHKNGLEETIKLKKSFVLDEKKSKELENFAKNILDNKYEKDAITKYEIWYPLPLLGKNICLIDSPGTNSLEIGHSDIAQEILDICDIAIYVLNAQKPLTENDLNIIKKVSQKVNTLFILLNKVDTIDESEQSCDSILDNIVYQIKTKANVNSFYIYPVSAKYALKGSKEIDFPNNKFDDFIKRLEFVLRKSAKKIITQKQKNIILQNFPDIENPVATSSNSNNTSTQNAETVTNIATKNDSDKIEDKEKKEKEQMKHKIKNKIVQIVFTVIFSILIIALVVFAIYKIPYENPFFRWRYLGATTLLNIFEKLNMSKKYENETKLLLSSFSNYKTFYDKYFYFNRKYNPKAKPDISEKGLKSLYYQVLSEFYIFNKNDNDYFMVFEEARKEDCINFISAFNYIILTGSLDFDLIKDFNVTLFLIPVCIIIFWIIIIKIKKLLIYPAFISKIFFIIAILYILAYIYFFIIIQSYFTLPFTHLVLISFFLLLLILSYIFKPNNEY